MINIQIDDDFDYFNKDKLQEFFRNKQIIKIDKYIKYLNGIFSNYLLEGQIEFNK